jgi:hypothetical protein
MPEFNEDEYRRALEMPADRLAHLVRGTRALSEASPDETEAATEVFMDCGAAAGVWENRVARDGKKEIYRPESTTDGYMAALYARMVAEDLL